MKKLIGFLAVFTLMTFALPTSAAIVVGGGGGDDDHDKAEVKFNFEPQLTPAACAAKGDPVINIKEKILNDVDSGTAGNYWGFDTINRHIKAWDLGNGTFCVTVNDEDSSYHAIAGQQSPGNTGTLSGNEHGQMRGGYRGIVTGTLLAQSAWPKHGKVGTVDYACDVSGNCPGYVSWMGKYFTPGYTFDYGFWGWVYNGVKDNKWVNACGADIPGNPACVGSSGDII